MQLNIFSNSKYTQLEKESRKLKKKRVHYKTPTYKKVYKNDIGSNITQNDTSNWGRMRQLHLTIANFFPIFFSGVEPTITEDNYKVYDFGIVRVWDNIYLPESYTHKGAIYKGQEFRVLEAEIVGTEDLNIQERLYIHETLLELLECGYRIEQLNWYLESLVNLFKQGWTANLLVLVMILEGAKNPPNSDERRIL